MIALYLSPLYICVCGYLFGRFVKWLGAGHSCFEKKSVRAIPFCDSSQYFPEAVLRMVIEKAAFP